MTAAPHRTLTAMPLPQAILAQGALRVEGITVRLERDALAGIYGLETGVFATRLLVPADQYDRARSLLDTLEGPS